MSTAPNALAEAGKGGLSPSHPSPNACFSCRLVSGGGLIGAAAYVFAMSQKSTWASTARGTIGKMAQLTFATGKSVVDFTLL